MRLVERLLSMTLPENNEEKDKTRRAVLSALEGHGIRQVEIAIGNHASFQPRYLEWLVFDVTDPSGISIGRGQILRDITQNRELDRMKSSLISTVSHELRTPLAAIKGYATTLLAEDVEWDQQAQHEFLEIISNETDRLTSLVNDLLDISRIEAGNLMISRTECDLNSLIHQAAQRAHPNPKNRLVVDLPTNLPMLYADPQRVEAILRNLIENAAKYSNEDTPILVNADFQSGKIIVRIEDEGPGIAPEYSQRIFESFYRIENGLTRRAPGAGLGLAICQGFVHAHGGEIWLEPRAKGTCVAFSLPLLNSREND
jgi:signal transduction histidine kinase